MTSSTTTTSTEARYRVDLPRPTAPVPAALDLGDGADVSRRIEVTDRYLSRDGRPWIPVMGEYHFVRDRGEVWERELRKMRAGGIDVLATYVFWLAHEEVEGEFRWDGDRDLREFVQIADRVGLDVVLRIGPWAHGETRNGGLPDWLQARDIAHRTDDPAYLEVASRWYAAIAGQVADLVHRAEDPDAPIIGIQIENELYDQPQHLSTLRTIAESVGLGASLFTATGWGGAHLPPGRFLPVYAGYADGFWEESDTGWPEFGRQHFTFSDVRDDLSVGADLRVTPADVDAAGDRGTSDPWPYATCELGSGMATAYHRRPLVDAQDVAALALTKLGSGSAWQGYYMFHGGLHFEGALSTTQESQATGYPNDVPVRDYDFFAPIGAAGTQRPHFHQLRRQHLFLSAFGDRLATCPARIGPSDPGGLRWSVRGDGDRGFLFVNTHQPALSPLDAVEAVTFEIGGRDAAVRVPSDPITVPSGSSFFWPLRQPLGDLSAVSATAQPITEIRIGDHEVVVLAASDGIEVEIQIDDVAPRVVRGASTTVNDDGRLVIRPDSAPGADCRVQVGRTTLVILDSATADAIWRGPVNGIDSVVIWPHGGWFDDTDFVAERQAADAEALVLTERADRSGVEFRRAVVEAADARHDLAPPVFPAAPVFAPRVGGSASRFAAPTEADFAEASVVEMLVPSGIGVDADQVVLRLDWVGDVMRLHIGDRLIADQFWSGRALEVDLSGYRDLLAEHPIRLEAFAWDPASPVHVDPRVRPAAGDPVLRVEEAALLVRRYARVRTTP
ncbi:beta-galactosidase [Microbacterium sp. ISL-103]|uniref:beta-galactosidase n=1 Tax=Microbacterium sp. ISL-103 TaxID=2819156 RepID=UPI001BEC6D98|nr:beta-galactosidase [Microbacterium sp. ISL-103]MBT2474491.1 beta-galactosidase [Microbacterium sp. ISL-103]